MKEVEAAFGPSCEHATAIGLELRLCEETLETLHMLRDDIYEKLTIVYGHYPEPENCTTDTTDPVEISKKVH